MAENYLHFALVRLRVNGTGSLSLSLKNLDDTITANLLPVTMSQTPGREPDRQCNYVSQRAKLRVGINKIRSNFKINRIILYANTLWTQVPNTE